MRQGHARYLFRPLPALLRHLPFPSFMFRSGLADLQSEEGTYEIPVTLSARETNIDAAAQNGYRIRLNSSGGQTCPDYCGY